MKVVIPVEPVGKQRPRTVRPLHGLPCPKPYIFAMEDGHTFIEWEPDEE